MLCLSVIIKLTEERKREREREKKNPKKPTEMWKGKKTSRWSCGGIDKAYLWLCVNQCLHVLSFVGEREKSTLHIGASQMCSRSHRCLAFIDTLCNTSGARDAKGFLAVILAHICASVPLFLILEEGRMHLASRGLGKGTRDFIERKSDWS